MTKTIHGKKLIILATITVLASSLIFAGIVDDAQAKGGNKIKAWGKITNVCFNAFQVVTGGVDCPLPARPSGTTVFDDHLDKGKWKVVADPITNTAKIKLQFKTTDGNKVKIRNIDSTTVIWADPILTINDVRFTITSNPPGHKIGPMPGTELCGQVIVNKMTETMEFDIASVPGCGPTSGIGNGQINVLGTVKKFKDKS